MQEKNIDCALVIIVKDDKVLGVTRGDEGDVSFPGGKVEVGEGFQECAIREALEETGHDIVLLDYPPYRNSHLRHWCITYLAKITTENSKPIAPNETGLVGWYSPQTLIESSFGVYNKQALEHFETYFKPNENKFKSENTMNNAITLTAEDSPHVDTLIRDTTLFAANLKMIELAQPKKEISIERVKGDNLVITVHTQADTLEVVVALTDVEAFNRPDLDSIRFTLVTKTKKYESSATAVTGPFMLDSMRNIKRALVELMGWYIDKMNITDLKQPVNIVTNYTAFDPTPHPFYPQPAPNPSQRQPTPQHYSTSGFTSYPRPGEDGDYPHNGPTTATLHSLPSRR